MHPMYFKFKLERNPLCLVDMNYKEYCCHSYRNSYGIFIGNGLFTVVCNQRISSSRTGQVPNRYGIVIHETLQEDYHWSTYSYQFVKISISN